MTIKPGYKTTEAAATLAASAPFLAAALSGHLSPRWASIASSVSVGLYAVSRGLAKLGAGLAASRSSSPAALTVVPSGSQTP